MKAPEKHVEAEAKFLLKSPAKQILKLLKWLRAERLSVGEPDEQLQVDHYFDTREWDLFRAGWSYRFRDSSNKRSVDLKSLNRTEAIGETLDGVHRRQEVAVPVEEFPDGDPIISKAPLAGELEPLITSGETSLTELFQVHTKRSTYKVANKKADFVLCVDDTTVETHENKADTGPMHFYELEIELQEGKEKNLRKLAARIEKELHFVPSRLSKFERGIQAAGLAPSRNTCTIPGNGMGPQTSILELAERYFRLHFDALLANEDRAFEGLDPDGVHKMRVASRRLRMGVDVFRPYLPETAHGLHKEIKWITRTLGEVRDLDVFRAAVAKTASEAKIDVDGFQAYLAKCWKSARRDLVQSLASKRHRQVKDELTAFIESDHWRSEPNTMPHRSAVELAGSILIPALEQITADGDRIDGSTADEKLHELRLEGKHLRYRLELFSPIIPGGLGTFVKASKRLQECLGNHQDACVALERIDAFAKSKKMKKPVRCELAKLRSIFQSRRVALREQYPATWLAYSSGASLKRLRKLFCA